MAAYKLCTGQLLHIQLSRGIIQNLFYQPVITKLNLSPINLKIIIE